MKAHEDEHEVNQMAELMSVSRSGFYRRRAGRKSARAQEDEVLSGRIERIHCRSRGTYGSPRITRELAREGTRLGKNRVARLMRLRGLSGVGRGRRWVRTTRQDPRLPVSPNLIKGLEVTGPNQVWVTDITYVKIAEGWGYLAAVLDLWSRKIVGWSFKSHMEASLVCQAMENALHQRRPPPGLIAHSDRGSQYASREYRNLLSRHGIQSSMSAKGYCYDNATMESFFGTLKSEEIYRREFLTIAAAREAIFDYIEAFYNRQRQHSSLDGCSPEEFETKKFSSPRGEEVAGPAVAGPACTSPKPN
jgi:transposase InsO family protein